MASPEESIETIIKSLITAALPTATVRGQDDNSSTVSVPNRITVDVAPKTPMLPARKETLYPPVWQSVVTITAKSNAATSTFDSWKDSIDDAISPSNNSYPVASTTLAASLFPSGLELFPLDGGEQQNDDQRVFTRTFRAMYRV